MRKKVVKEKQIIFDTELVQYYTDQINDGIIVKRFQNPWYKGEIGLKRAGTIFRMSAEEQEEYVKCAVDIHYFTEVYCKVKTDDGTVNNIFLRPYQKEVLDDFVNKRFNILCSSRQSGKTIMSSIFMLHTILFKNDKNIMIIANKGDTATEIVEKIKAIYSLLPFFLKPGIKVWNQKSLTFDNGCKIKTSARSKTPAIGFTIDILYMDEFAHIPSNIIDDYYTAAYPTVSSISNSKIIITSTPNGMNLFHKLLTAAERPVGDPLKNNYNARRIYWYEVDGRFVTYIRLNPLKLSQHGIDKEFVFDKVKERFESKTKLKMSYNLDLDKDIIHVFNNDEVSDEMVKTFTLDIGGEEVSIRDLAEVTTWKEEAIKDIGSEDAFNQEYGLRFINSSRSLLNESIINDLLKNKKNYVYRELAPMDRLKFSYNDLTWVDDEEIFLESMAKKYKVIMSVDLSEGLGQDYSIINIFKVALKSRELIEKQRGFYTSIVDFFCLEQIGLFRNNFVSLKQLAHLLYLLGYEYFEPENVKIVLELNNYGGTLLAEMPQVFDGENEYGSEIFLRYKHRVDATEEKIGLKIGENKKLLIKDYQDLMKIKSFNITNIDNINEITTFVKHETSAGNIRYAADGSNTDDIVMSLINSGSVFKKINFLEMVQEWLDTYETLETKNYIYKCLEDVEYVESVDYKQVLDVKNKYHFPKTGYGIDKRRFNK